MTEEPSSPPEPWSLKHWKYLDNLVHWSDSAHERIEQLEERVKALEAFVRGIKDKGTPDQKMPLPGPKQWTTDPLTQ